MDHTENVEVIDLESSEDEDEDENDANELSLDTVPFKEKVEKWLMDCNGAHARALIRDSERIFQEKTVVVKEVVNETASSHSVDTEQYIKSNRRKTTTKVTTTTIQKYYSVIKVENNNAERNTCDRQTLPAIGPIGVDSNEDEKYSCKVIRKSPRKRSNNLPSVPQSNQSKVNPKKRRTEESDTDRLHVDDIDSPHMDLNRELPANVPQNSDDGLDIAGTPYNIRPNNEAKHKIRLCTEMYKNKGAPRRAPVTKKQNPLSTRGCRVKLKSYGNGTNSLPADDANTKPKAAAVPYRRYSEDSEQDDILLTSYKPFSLCP